MAMFVQWRDDVVMLSIASNRNENIEALKASARERSLPVVLVDAESAIANLYEAQATPHVFVIDRGGILRYRGSIDDVSFRQRKPTRFFLDEAVESLLAGRLPEISETVIYGCAIVREI